MPRGMTTTTSPGRSSPDAMRAPVVRLQAGEVRDELDKIRTQLEEVLPSHMDPERFLRVVTGAILRSPRILECDRVSVFRAVIEAAQLGLEPTGLLGSAYIVPYREHGVMMAHLIPGYRGLIDLARRSGEIESIYAHVVRARDVFRLVQGSEPRIDHEPFIGSEGDPDPGPIVGAYAIAVLRDRSGQASLRQSEWMSAAQIESVRRRSRAADDGPWVSDYDEMARKTVVRRAAKYLPLTPEAVHGFSLDEIAERSADDRVRVSEPTSGRSRLVATLAQRRGIPSSTGDGPDGSSDPSDSLPVAGTDDGSPPESQAVAGRCGSTSDPHYGPVESCDKPAGHEGPHKSPLASWPAGPIEGPTK